MSAEELVSELWDASTPSSRCPHLARDEGGCECRSPGCEDPHRRAVVDHFSLQLWCLDLERVRKCLFYREP